MNYRKVTRQWQHNRVTGIDALLFRASSPGAVSSSHERDGPVYIHGLGRDLAPLVVVVWSWLSRLSEKSEQDVLPHTSGSLVLSVGMDQFVVAMMVPTWVAMSSMVASGFRYPAVSITTFRA